MNWEHLQTFFWLRWRIRKNQLRRGGTANTIVLMILTIGALLLSLALFIIFLFIGMSALKNVSPMVVMYVWDGLVVVFLFFWGISLIADLQRSDILSLNKFLHFPVSLAGAFVVNYVSSLASFNLVLFVPPMLGLSLGLLLAKGPAMLWQFPLIAALILMVTALTYQFQGWLAAVMVNPRKRRAAVVFLTMGFVLISQLPNLINVFRPWENAKVDSQVQRLDQEKTELAAALQGGKVTPNQYKERVDKIEAEQKARKKEVNAQTLSRIENSVWLMNLVLPFGWLPFGAMSAAEGDSASPLLGMLGLTLIGGVSLRRAYRTTIRYYTGQLTSKKKAAASPAPTSKPSRAASNLMEKQLPWISEHAATIALGCLRSLTRAPEAKMMLLTPVILIFVFGSMFLSRRVESPVPARPLFVFGGMGLVLLTMTQMIGNQFGFDRSGFRVLVLCPARRRDVLFGKNVGFAPLTIGLGLFLAVAMQFLQPMRLDHFLAVIPLLIMMHLLFCMLANLLSILAPMPIAPGSLKPVHPKLIPILLQVAFTFLMPVVLSPVLLPLGIEFLLDKLTGLQGLPICLALSVVECVVMAYLYHLVLGLEGQLLQMREQKILQTVTAQVE